MMIGIRIVLLLAFFSLSFAISLAQSPTAKVDFEDPYIDFFEELIRIEINKIREEKGLPTLSINRSLSLAAKDQAKYNFKKNQLGSNQGSAKKASPILRANFFDGEFALVDESDFIIQMGEKTKVKGIRGRLILQTYKDAQEAIISELQENRYDVENLVNPKFHNIGVGTVFIPGLNQIIVSIVFGCEPYEKIDGLKYSKNSYRLQPYDRNKCRSFEREYGYLPELFSTSLKIENGQILFNFHDLNLMESILETSRDRLAVDIVKRDQFDCYNGNRDHPSEIATGYLLKPQKKGKLLRKNPLKEDKKFEAILGEFPSQLDKNNVELNLIIIKDKCNCQTIYYNNYDGKNLRLLDVDFTLDTLSISEDIDSLSRQLNFAIQFEKNKAEYEVEDIKPILDSIQLNRFDIQEIEIKAYSSIEGDSISNEKLQQKRANSILKAIQEYQLKEVQTSVMTFENWDGFKESIAESPFSESFKNLSKPQIRDLVNTDTLTNQLEPYLEGQRKAEVKIIVESIFIDSLTPRLLPKKFQKAINNNEPILAKGIQTMMLKNVSKGILQPDVLFPDFFIPFTKENMPIMNNIVAFKYKYQTQSDIDSLYEELKSDIIRYHGIDPGNPHISYNKLLIELFYWSRNIHYLMVDKEAKIDQPRDLYKAIRKMYNTKIDNWKVNQLLLNYYIIAADFYYETQDFKMREKSLKNVRKLLRKSNLNREQTYLMAGYFMFQIQMEWAIEIMMPFFNSGDYDEDFLFRLISISIYNEDLVPEKKFIELLDKARELNSDRYCELFGQPNMSFQLLSNPNVKKTYCKTCKSQ